MHKLNPKMKDIILKAWLRRNTPGSRDYHPAKADKIARRFPVVFQTLDVIASASLKRWERLRGR